jgi:hypothetical protein
MAMVSRKLCTLPSSRVSALGLTMAALILLDGPEISKRPGTDQVTILLPDIPDLSSLRLEHSLNLHNGI